MLSSSVADSIFHVKSCEVSLVGAIHVTADMVAADKHVHVNLLAIFG